MVSKPLIYTFLGRELQSQDVRHSSLRALLDSHSKNNEKFLVYYDKNKKTKVSTFQDFHQRTQVLASELFHHHEIRQGDPVLVMVGNSLESFFIYASLLYLGAVVVPVDPAESTHHLETIAAFSKAKKLIALFNSKEKFKDIRLQKVFLNVNQTLGDNQKISAIPETPSSLELPAALFFTSGTTGDAKGVMLSVGNILANLEGTRLATGLSCENILFSCLPLYHVNAFNFAFLLPLYLGCKIIYQNGFFPNFWNVVREENVEVASLSPPVLRLLLKDQRPQPSINSLKYIISASSALGREELTEFLRRFKIRINQAYGLSETVNFTLFTPPTLSEEKYRELVFSDAAPPAGIPVWGNSVLLLDEAGQEIIESDRRGELVVRGWNVMQEYLNNPQANKIAFHGDFFHTGDIAYFKEFSDQKFYFLCGRIKEVIKRQGKLIYLSEIDQALRAIGLNEACAVGFKNEFTEEEVGLFLVRGADERSHQEILVELSKLLQPMKLPKIIVEGDMLPRTSVGKVRRKELIRLFTAYANTKF
jgi:acyl-CoA synthetase (AMP-forming)/AMP-acid ligase II